MLPEPSVQVSHDPTVADSGQQSVSAGLYSASVVYDHSEMYLFNIINNYNSLF